MNKTEDDEFIYCKKCEENGRTDSRRGRIRKKDLEETQWKDWICHQCDDKEIGLKLIDFIKTRIQVTEPEDNRSRFIFRELLQNADDVKANILVLRFEEDALYVANDGRAFTTGSNGDFARISRVLGRHQAEDKEVVGHFGSGFQTVYAITNSPEVHSSGRSGRMNPYTNKWDYSFEALFRKRDSPYLHKTSKGVLFRFPWRDDTAAREEIRGERVWEDRTYWPRWSKRERRELFEDLKEYVHPAIICCQHLKAIRLIWHEERPPEKELYEGFQVVRDFRLQINDPETSEMKWFNGSVKQGTIEPKEWKGEQKWEDSFQLEKSYWHKDARSFDYLIGEKNVSENDKRIFLGKKTDSSVAVTTDRGTLEKELKRGDLFVLFPLFDVTSVFKHANGRAYLYSIIPLAMRGKNKFIFSAHFWPAEDRKDVSVEGPNGIFGEWYRHVMLNVVGLYEWLFDEFLNQIHKIEMPEDARQKIILNSLPGAVLSEWMRPGKENRAEWSHQSKERFDKLILSLTDRPILFSNGEWVKPTVAYWAHDDEEQVVFELMEHRVFTDNFINHPHFIKTLSEKLKDREIDEAKFNNCWNKFVLANKNGSDNLIYGQNLENGQTLDREAVDCLIRYCITGEHVSIGKLLKAVVPGRDGVLRKLEKYPVLPAQLEFLRDALPGSKIIHDDFMSPELVVVHKKEVEAYVGDQVIYLIDEMVRKDPARFRDLSKMNHLTFSRTLRTLVDEMDWTPRDGLKNYRFIPYREGGRVSLGTLNVRRAKGGTEWISSQSTKEHVQRNYERDSIFGVQTLKVPGLTPEVESRIKFLSLLDCDDEAVSNIEVALHLVKLMAVKDTPANFVRHFLSPQHGSLFDDTILRNFLGISDEKRLAEQKKQFQEALKLYFKEEHSGEHHLRREDMKKVPCLYDEQGNWYQAGEFALALEPELKMLGYKSLHEDLRKWPPETLLALGVDHSPSSSKVVDSIRRLAMEKEKHRKDLANIILWLLTSGVPIDTEFDQLRRLEWVPTTDGLFKKPVDVLIPNSKNKEVLGDGFVGLDLSSCSREIDETKIRPETTRKRAQSLGFKLEPSLSDMLSVVKKLRKANCEPPKQLFDALNKEVGSDPQKTGELMWGKQFGYYVKGRWVNSCDIKIMEEENIPKEIRGTLTVMPTNHPHSRYLVADGAASKLDSEDILRPMKQKEILPSPEIWDKLRELASSIYEEYRELYGKAPIYPIDDHQVCPEEIVCIDNESTPFLKEGAIGKWYALGRKLSQRHGEVLKKLGARCGSELTRNDIMELIKSQKAEKAALDGDEISLVLRLIRRLQTLGLEAFPDEALWPAERDGQVVWMEPRSSYVNDSPLSKYFERDLSFICLKIDGKVDAPLKDYAVANGCKAFFDSLEREDRIDTGNVEEDSQGAFFYGELAKALSQYFRSLPSSECFEWLKNVEVKRCDKIVVHYSIDEKKTIIDRAALVENEDSRWVISSVHSSPQAKLLDQLTGDIANMCIEQGFPNSELDKLQSIIYKLLTCKQEEWIYHVEDYHPVSSVPQEFSPIEPVDIDSVMRTFHTLKEVHDLNLLEMSEKGYVDTKRTLQMWYQCCQICGSRTPADEFGYATNETLKRVVCRRGGRYRGEPEGFSTDNSVLLCPTHQVLWVRGLVMFSDLEKPSEEVIRQLQQRIEEYEKKASEDPQKSVKWDCDVFEGKSKRDTDTKIGSWKNRAIEFRTEHLLGFLKTMLEYCENNKEKSLEP